MSILFRTIEDTLLGQFLNIDSPAALWTSLWTACAGNMVTQKLVLRQKLFNLRFLEGQPMATNFLTLNSLIHDLASIVVSFPNEDLTSFCINALPPSWETFRLVIANKDTLPTYVQLETLLREEELRHVLPHFSGEEALFTYKQPPRGPTNFLGHGQDYTFGRGRADFTPPFHSGRGHFDGRGDGRDDGRGDGHGHAFERGFFCPRLSSRFPNVPFVTLVVIPGIWPMSALLKGSSANFIKQWAASDSLHQ